MDKSSSFLVSSRLVPRPSIVPEYFAHIARTLPKCRAPSVCLASQIPTSQTFLERGLGAEPIIETRQYGIQDFPGAEVLFVGKLARGRTLTFTPLLRHSSPSTFFPFAIVFAPEHSRTLPSLSRSRSWMPASIAAPAMVNVPV